MNITMKTVTFKTHISVAIFHYISLSTKKTIGVNGKLYMKMNIKICP